MAMPDIITSAGDKYSAKFAIMQNQRREIFTIRKRCTQPSMKDRPTKPESNLTEAARGRGGWHGYGSNIWHGWICRGIYKRESPGVA